eukprot:4320042-Amphidinium_carterae.1
MQLALLSGKVHLLRVLRVRPIVPHIFETMGCGTSRYSKRHGMSERIDCGDESHARKRGGLPPPPGAVGMWGLAPPPGGHPVATVMVATIIVLQQPHTEP